MRTKLFIGILMIIGVAVTVDAQTLRSGKSVEPDATSQDRSGESGRKKKDPWPIVPAAKKMVEEELLPQGNLSNEAVLDAVSRVPREKFVPPVHRSMAYRDTALPIGNAQTISPPYIVSYMTEKLDPQPDDVVLEIGTGSGYQAAVLALLVKEVYSIEIVEPLGKRAAQTLKKIGYSNVFTKVGDGYQGWPDAAPFDKIIVTCSPESVPQPLIDQLKDGGLMIIPLGERYQQYFQLLRKKGTELETESLTPALFVPMTGEAENARVVLPDPKNPEIIGGDFEQTTESGHPIGWHYARNATVVDDPQAESGLKFIRFEIPAEARFQFPVASTPFELQQMNRLQQMQQIQQMQQLELQRQMTMSGRMTPQGAANSGITPGGVNTSTFPAPETNTNAPRERADPAANRRPGRDRERREKANPADKETVKTETQNLKVAQIIQGFAVDGKSVSKLKVEASIRANNVLPLQVGRQKPSGTIQIHFYDEDRDIVQQIELAPVVGTFEWKKFSTDVSVPKKAKEAILFLGLFQMSGTLDMDAVSVQKR